MRASAGFMVATLLLLVIGTACEGDEMLDTSIAEGQQTPPDAGVPDAAPPDAGVPDAAPPDAGVPDATPPSDCDCAGAPDGTSCGEPTDNECESHTCYHGLCVVDTVADGTACGDDTEDECNGADTCQAGVCVDNLAEDGTPCGDSSGKDCDGHEKCVAGECVDKHH